MVVEAGFTLRDRAHGRPPESLLGVVVKGSEKEGVEVWLVVLVISVWQAWICLRIGVRVR